MYKVDRELSEGAMSVLRLELVMMSWSVLSHVLSEEQSKDGSNGVSDDGC